MPELRDIFEMSTKQVEPDADALEQQQRRQRRATRNRRLGAYAVAASLAVVVGVLAFVLKADGERGGETEIAGTPPPPQGLLALSELRGVWFEEDGSHLLSIERDGSYALDDSGLLDTDPADIGTVEIGADGSIQLVSGAASRECSARDAWVWESAEIVPLRVAGPVAGRALQIAESKSPCSAGIEGPSSWRFVGSFTPVGVTVPGPDEAPGRPVTEANLVGFWVDATGGGLFRYSADGTFAAYHPAETLESGPLFAATWEIRGGRIRLVRTSTSEPGCEPGDVTVIDAELVELDVGVALRADTLRSCGLSAPASQIRVSPR